MRLQTYKFYDFQGRRLAIFYEEGIITVIPCSKKDQFSIKKAKELYVSGCKSMEKHEVKDITKIDHLVAWCHKKYLKRSVQYVRGFVTGINGTKTKLSRWVTTEIETLQ